MKIQLTKAEILSAAHVGAMRQVSNLKHGRSPAHGDLGLNDWQIHIEGALAEAAVAKALNCFWLGAVGNLDAPDVSQLQVRSTVREKGHLIVRESDKDEDAFILVIGQNGRYRLAGWILGEDAKDQRFLQNPHNRGPCYFVPQHELLFMEILIDEGRNRNHDLQSQ